MELFGKNSVKQCLSTKCPQTCADTRSGLKEFSSSVDSAH